VVGDDGWGWFDVVVVARVGQWEAEMRSHSFLSTLLNSYIYSAWMVCRSL